MKKTILLSICFFMIGCSLSGIAQANNRKALKNVVIPKLEVYYFISL